MNLFAYCDHHRPIQPVLDLVAIIKPITGSTLPIIGIIVSNMLKCRARFL